MESCRPVLFLSRDLARESRLEAISTVLGSDFGTAVIADLPEGRAAVVDLIAVVKATGTFRRNASHAVDIDGVRLVERRAGDMLGLAARCLGPPVAPAATTRRIMEALAVALARHGLSFLDVVKQQTYYVGGASEQDLYENMRIRSGYYSRPGPASTGLAVYGFVDLDCRITIELLAADRS
jgi:hypothetical protein